MSNAEPLSLNYQSEHLFERDGSTASFLCVCGRDSTHALHIRKHKDKLSQKVVENLSKEDTTAGQLAREVLRLKQRIEKPQHPEQSRTIDPTTDTRYRDHIRKIASADAERVLAKDEEYGASWKKRGGVGAYFVMIRKVDRLNAQIPHPRHGYDILKALGEGVDVGEEGLIDTIRDLRGYLLLIEAEVFVRSSDEGGPISTPKRDDRGRQNRCNGMHDDGIADGNLTACDVNSGCGLPGCRYVLPR